MNETMKLTNTYWEMLKSLSNDVKLRLATRLTASVATSKACEKDRTEVMIDKHCGTWNDERSAEEIIKDIYDSRSNSRNPLKFD